MKLPSDYSQIPMLFSQNNKLNEEWKFSLSPLANDFFHPYLSIFSHQLNSELDFISQDLGTIFLKDGILGLVVLLLKMIKGDASYPNKFAIPFSLAPLVPKNLQSNFFFYKYVQASSIPDRCLSKAVIFLGALDPHTSSLQLQNDLTSLTGKLDQIFLLVSHNFNSTIDQSIGGSTDHSMKLLENYRKIKEIFPNLNIKAISKVQFLSLDLNDMLLLNTNHYNMYCGDDYLNYMYYFKTGRLPLSFLNDIPKMYIETNYVPLIKNLGIQLYTYSGPHVLESEQIKKMLNITITNSKKAKHIHQYYTPEIQTFASQLANNLFQTNLELRGISV
jgi:hypothetical protein